MPTKNVFLAALGCAALAVTLEAPARAQGREALPVCHNNAPYLQECNGQFSSIPVTSAGSYDPDGTPITVLWFEECPYAYFDDPTNPTPNFIIGMDFNCVRNCIFALRVFSGGQMTHCQGNATSQDTTAPIFTPVGDIVGIFGIATDVGSTGSPTAIDACDPNPVVALISENHISSFGPGSEDTIVRSWVATDNCGHSTPTSQTITLLSPLGGQSNLEVDVNQCDDVFDRGDGSTTFDVTLLGRTGSLISSLNLNTLRIARLGDQVNLVAPLNPTLFAPTDVAISAALHIGDCNPAGVDGRQDLRLRFDRALIRSAMGLDPLAIDTYVYVAITGKRKNGTSYIAGAKMRVH